MIVSTRSEDIKGMLKYCGNVKKRIKVSPELNRVMFFHGWQIRQLRKEKYIYTMHIIPEFIFFNPFYVGLIPFIIFLILTGLSIWTFLAAIVLSLSFFISPQFVKFLLWLSFRKARIKAEIISNDEVMPLLLGIRK